MLHGMHGLCRSTFGSGSLSEHLVRHRNISRTLPAPKLSPAICRGRHTDLLQRSRSSVSAKWLPSVSSPRAWTWKGIHCPDIRDNTIAQTPLSLTRAAAIAFSSGLREIRSITSGPGLPVGSLGNVTRDHRASMPLPRCRARRLHGSCEGRAAARRLS